MSASAGITVVGYMGFTIWLILTGLPLMRGETGIAGFQAAAAGSSAQRRDRVSSAPGIAVTSSGSRTAARLSRPRPDREDRR
jgi:hypothetical protein